MATDCAAEEHVASSFCDASPELNWPEPKTTAQVIALATAYVEKRDLGLRTNGFLAYKPDGQAWPARCPISERCFA